MRRAALALAVAHAFVLLYAPQPFLPLLAREFGVSAGEAGLLVTFPVAALALTAFALVPVADRFRRGRLAAWAAAAAVVPVALAAAADAFWLLALARGLQGACVAALLVPLLAHTAERAERGARGRALGGFAAATVAGAVLGRLVAGGLADALSWRAALWALAGWSALVAVLALRGLEAGASRRAAGPVAARPGVLGTLLVGGFGFFAFVAFGTYLPFRAGEELGLSTAAVSLLYLAYAAGLVSGPVAGRASDRLGRRRTIAAAQAVAVAGLGLALVADVAVLVLGACVFALGDFAARAATTALLGDLAGAATGAAAALHQGVYYAGGTLGAFLPGLAWGAAGWSGVVAASVAALAAAMASALGLTRPRRSR